MKNGSGNTTLAEEAFSKQSAVFDAEYKEDVIVNYKRKRVREHLEKQLKPNSNILELNAGTGEDAIYLAEKGHRIHCTDISEGMLKELRKKTESRNLMNSISLEQCSFLDLDKLKPSGKYNHIFSNFGGLNCTNDLNKVLKSLNSLLTNDGGITLVIMPKFCLWENLLAFKGNFKTAFRRYDKNGAPSHIEGVHFRSWYYTPEYVVEHLKENFKLTQLEGLCTLVPPSYLKNFPYKLPRLFNFLKTAENKFSTKWPWKKCGDYFIISFKKITV